MVESDKFIMFGMDDPNLKKVSEALSNKTAKKIINYLSENKEASEKDLSDKMKVPLNTIEYNIKKLLEVGIVKKHKNFFWSKRGKKIVIYELSNKSIVISPRGSSVTDKLKSLVPGFLVVSALSFAVYVYEKLKFNSVSSERIEIFGKGADIAQNSFVNEGAKIAVETASNTTYQFSSSPLWMWFFLGGLIALGVVALINWNRL